MYNGEYKDHDFGIKCDGNNRCDSLTIIFDENHNKFYCAEHAKDEIRDNFRYEGPEGWLERVDTGEPGICDSCKKQSTKSLWHDEDYDDKICVDCCEEEYMGDDNDILDSAEDWGMTHMMYMEQSELEKYAEERKK